MYPSNQRTLHGGNMGIAHVYWTESKVAELFEHTHSSLATPLQLDSKENDVFEQIS